MPAQEISNYIQEAKKSGLDSQIIRENLIKAGWPEAEVDEALGLPPMPQPQIISGAESRTLMAIFAYLGPLVFIPYLSGDAKKDNFVKFHTQQGLVLLITWLIYVALDWFLPGIFWLLAGLGITVLAIMGVINAATGKMVGLPFIGQYAKKIKIQ